MAKQQYVRVSRLLGYEVLLLPAYVGCITYQILRYLKHIDTYPPTNSHISCFLAGTNVRFLLLHQPSTAPTTSSSHRSSTISSTSIPHNPTSPQTEEAIKQFMNEVFEIWVKTLMNPFYRIGMHIKSPIFRQRVSAAGRKWL